jgi:antitoxin (DNA-binding transcriptional repressor) of toxin-antitoxin stability system
VARKGTAKGRVAAVRRWWVVGVVVVVVGIALGAWLLARGDGDDSPQPLGDRRAAALAFAPTSAEVVVEFDVQSGSPQGARLRDLARTFAAARFAADGVRSSVRRLGLDADAELPALLGGPVVAWGPAAAVKGLGASVDGLALDLPAVARAGVSAVVVGRSADAVGDALEHAVDDGRLTKVAAPASNVEGYAPPGRAVVFGRRGAEVVLGADRAAVKRAFATRDAGGGLTPGTFAERLGPLARVPGLIRAAGPARPLLASRAKDVPWADALREGSLAVTLQDPGVRLRVHLATDPARLTDDQLPLAPGAQPPRPAPGTRQIAAGIRDPARTVRFLDDNKDALDLPFLDSLASALASLDSVKGPLKTFGRIDVDDILAGLTGTATITPEGGDALALRAELTTGGQLKTALDRLAAVPDVALDLAGVSLNVSRDGDAYIITNDGHPVAKLAVLGTGDTTLVATNRQAVSLRAVAARKPAAATTVGALSLHLGGRALQDELVRRLGLPDLSRLVLNGFGDVDAGVRAERGGVDLDATLTLD